MTNLDRPQEELLTYGEAIRSAFDYLLSNYPEVFVIGQGLWSPWYVGNSMTDLDKKYGEARLIDTPVSEAACTGAAVGASLAGMRPIVVHPRMDFMLYEIDPIVNQAAKWSSMFGGNASPAVTIRAIINRGGEQGAQHSQALHSWFAHIPGLRVVMPSTVRDARDLLIASVLSNDPVIYIDDRWLYDRSEVVGPVPEIPLVDIMPNVLREGKDVTIVASGYSTYLAEQALGSLDERCISGELIDLRVLNPLDCTQVIDSVRKTRRLLVVDGGWKSCGLAGEVIASTVERIPPSTLESSPIRLTLKSAPAPCSTPLEERYYNSVTSIVDAAASLFRI